MPTQPSGNPPAYGAIGYLQSDGSWLVDTEDGVSVFVPSFGGVATGGLSGGQVSPVPNWQQTGGVPVLNAILVELRVMNMLLREQLGASPLDLNQMRADELFNIITTSGQV